MRTCVCLREQVLEVQDLEILSLEISRLEVSSLEMLSPNERVQSKWASLVMNESSFTEWSFISHEEASM